MLREHILPPSVREGDRASGGRSFLPLQKLPQSPLGDSPLGEGAEATVRMHPSVQPHSVL